MEDVPQVSIMLAKMKALLGELAVSSILVDAHRATTQSLFLPMA
jgi:hypothetical protein